jgi:hypothetical protein
LLSRWAAGMRFTVQPGPSEDIRFSRSGPYDERLGYAQLPSFIVLQTASTITTAPAFSTLALKTPDVL